MSFRAALVAAANAPCVRQRPFDGSVCAVQTTNRETAMAAKFEISQDKAGKFRFHLKAANGEIIAVRQAYDTKAGAEKRIESVKTNASAAKVVDLTERAPAQN